jgi:hypothetical protein
MANNNEKNGNESTVVDSNYAIVIDLSNTRLKQVTICNKMNQLYKIKSNQIMIRLQKTDLFDSPINDTIQDQPSRVRVISVQNTKQRDLIPFTLLGFLMNDLNNRKKNIIYEVHYQNNYGTRSVMTTALYQGLSKIVNLRQSILIMYIDEEKKVRFVGSHYIMRLMPSTNINLKLATFFSNQLQYMNDYYSIREFEGNFNGGSNLLIHLNPTEKKMEPYLSLAHNLPFMDMKVNLITINHIQGSAYCIRNVHLPYMVTEMSKYVTSPLFESFYSMKIGSSELSSLLNEMKAGDFTQEYDRFIFFFMKEMDLLINFKNWIRHLANEIGVDAYISFVNGAGLNVQLNVMKHNSIQNMNLGIHTDYPVRNLFLYPSDATNKRKTARTILTYVDLYELKQPVIGFTTRITGIKQRNAERTLSEYSIYNKCASYIRLTDAYGRIETINNETYKKINEYMAKYDIIMKETNILDYFTMIDLIVIPDIDDPHYYFKELKDSIKFQGFDNYRSIFNGMNAIIKEAVDSNPDINNWNAVSIIDDRDKLKEMLREPFTVFKNKIITLAKNNSTPFHNLMVRLDTMFQHSTDEGDIFSYAYFMVDINYFITFTFNFVDPPPQLIKDLSAYLIEELRDTKQYDNFIEGKACPFIDGGMVYFNGENSHTLDSGIGKRISIVYKVSYVDRQPDNPLSIEEREKAYFDRFKDDVPLPIHTTKNNSNIPTGHVPMKVNVSRRARNFGGKQTIRHKRKQNRTSRKKHVKR